MGRSANAEPEARHPSVRRIRIRSRSGQRHRWHDQRKNGHDFPDGADERRPAHRRPEKEAASNQSFWLVGRPDVDLRQITKGDHKGKWEVEVQGFDYYNTRTGTIDSGDTSKIAMWLLDTDYDGRSLYPRQVFFPMADADGGWARLAKNLKAEIDPDLIEAYRGTVSLPFEPGEYKRIAVKVIDDRGIESLKVVEVK